MDADGNTFERHWWSRCRAALSVRDVDAADIEWGCIDFLDRPEPPLEWVAEPADRVQVATSRTDKQGSMYYDFVPGVDHSDPYASSPGSLSIHYDSYQCIEPLVRHTVAGYEPYGVGTATRAELSSLIPQLEALEVALETNADLAPFGLPVDIRQAMTPALRNQLSTVARTFAEWIEQTLEHHDGATILGL